MHDLLYRIFADLPRQGPGDRASTQKALEMVVGLPPCPDILDIGCGTGRQTLDLADLTPGRITAVDNHAPFLARLRAEAAARTLQAEITTVLGDMTALDLPAGNFDLIWSEGAVYIMGFAEALRRWRPLLRPDGSLVISEIAWFKPDPPPRLRDYWASELPGLKYFQDHVPLIKTAGYELDGHFRLPDQSWWTDLYQPLEAKLEGMREEYRGDREALEFLDSLQIEIEMHRQYSEFYGYVFYIMRRAD